MNDRNTLGIPLPDVKRSSATRGARRLVHAPDDRDSLVAAGVYSDGRKVSTPATLSEAFQILRTTTDGFAWIGLYRPDENEIGAIADEFGLHALAVEDAVVAHQRPKMERYDDVLFMVLRAADYVDEDERLEFGELHLFVGPNFIVTLRHSEAPQLTGVRSRMEANPDLLALGPHAVLYAIIDAVVDEYVPVVQGLSNDIDEIEEQVFEGDTTVSRRIYELSREVIAFERAEQPLLDVVRRLELGSEKYGVAPELQRGLRDVSDHLQHIDEKVMGFRQLLRDILTVNGTLVAQRQNDEIARMTETSLQQGEVVKRISAWAAILFGPTIITGVYGMNFDVMPELHWLFGYPFALALLLASGVTLYAVFKRKTWL
ncbi:magnesium and cobalt transport protein CorA [Labedella populi]|uniref:Magnesium and cobalt transport protein CorA n=1 Tax=Labedella populi TaxID=2498850 RepID=A0A3S4BE06_9MICO|nr:magnesium and cobalt transport protein CorA [Labedella populi]RWZ68493.1 magnesium and cobalt transport protein CorA [Labedella populi]